MYKIISMKVEEGKEKAASRCKSLMQLVIDESRRRYSAMKYARGMLAGFYILISVFSFISLSGCLRGDYRGGNRGYIRGGNRGDDRGERHYYRDGRWYRRGLSGLDIVVSALAIGAFIDSLPPRHTTVVVEGTPYYHDDRYYYRRASNGGYVVVPVPVIVQPQSQSNNDERGEKGGKHNEENRGESH
jgi:hypothetical protein